MEKHKLAQINEEQMAWLNLLKYLLTLKNAGGEVDKSREQIKKEIEKILAEDCASQRSLPSNRHILPEPQMHF